MPELPEVETMRRGILPIVGSTITNLSLPPCPRRPIAITPAISVMKKRLVDKKITAISRAGKRVVVEIEGDWLLLFEPRMTGLVLLSDPPTQEHLRFCLELEGGPHSEVWYWDRRGLGSVTLLDTQTFRTKILEGKLGPDALEISATLLEERLKRSSRAIKVALLDQKIVAGIGNLYASEILHKCGIHPESRCCDLSTKQYEEIHRYIGEVLRLAIKHEGSTLSDGTYRNALNQSGGYQNHHLVYDREGTKCESCRIGTILRIVQTQRATFFCPHCQPLPKKHPSTNRRSSSQTGRDKTPSKRK